MNMLVKRLSSVDSLAIKPVVDFDLTQVDLVASYDEPDGSHLSAGEIEIRFMCVRIVLAYTLAFYRDNDRVDPILWNDD
mgnify:CR=1 FL=1